MFGFLEAHAPSTSELTTSTVDNGYLVRYYDAEKERQRTYYFATPGELGAFIANYYEMLKEGKNAVS